MKECDVDDQHPTLLETCKAVLEQGINKGKGCSRPPSENGYCGKHQTIASVEIGKQEGKHKCMTYRCNEMIIEGKFCKGCSEEKKTFLHQCKAIIVQGKNKGKQCDKESSTPEGYCRKHVEINLLQQNAEESGIRICDDGKRACKKYTMGGKLKCEECLEKTRIKEREEHATKRDSGNCLGCGCELEKFTDGFRRPVQRCQECYEKYRMIENERDRGPRNYLKEKSENMERYYREYQIGANKRGLLFDISFELFSETVTKECFYCKEKHEVSGIDRINNSLGYIPNNIIPCCELCNKMKGTLTLENFKQQINRIYTTLNELDVADITPLETEQKKSYVRPKDILKYYTTNNLEKYIEHCIADERSSTFVQRIRDLSLMKLSETDARAYIKNILKNEANSVKHTERERVSKKEMFGYLQLKNIQACVSHYEKVHGIPYGFRKDIETLMETWTLDDNVNRKEFDRILIKYQNKRNNSTSYKL